MSDEQKTPKAGEWTEPPAIDPGEGYELLPKGALIQEGDQYFHDGKWKSSGIRGCQSGWYDYRRKIKPAEVWPKWYVLDETQGSSESPWYIKRTSENERLRYGKCYDGTIGFEEYNGWPKLKPVSWIEVTEAEALARVAPPKPVNLLSNCPDCGEFRGHGHTCKPPVPEFCVSCGVHSVVPGTKECGPCIQRAIDDARFPVITTGNAPPNTFKITPVESPAVKRVPVRLWVHHDCRSDERYNVFVKLTPPGESNLYREILHDADGFYFEEQPE